jgi:hypothetical protein
MIDFFNYKVLKFKIKGSIILLYLYIMNLCYLKYENMFY